MVAFLRSLFGKKNRTAGGTALQSGFADSNSRAAPVLEAAPVHITDQTFAERVVNSPLPVLLDFWAPWCGPCRALAPVLEELARAYSGRVLVAKLDTDENRSTADQFGIRSIPTLIVFKDGREADRLVGYTPRHVIEEKLQAVLG